MISVIKIINLYFWKSFFGPFFSFIFPLIFVALLGSLLGFDQLLGGAMAIASMSIALTAMPQAIFEFKRSALLKRIGVTPIKPWMFLFVAGIFYFIIMIIATFWTMGIGIAIFSSLMDKGREIVQIGGDASGEIKYYLLSPTLGATLANVNWAGFFWGVIMNIIVGISLGFVLVSTSKSTLAIQGLGIPILIISQFLSAQVLPLPMIIDASFMKYISYLSPFRYSTGLMIESFTSTIDFDALALALAQQPIMNDVQILIASSSNIFDVSTPFEMLKYQETGPEIMFGTADKIVNLIMPFVFTGIFSGIAVKTFKWSTR
ncbi:MAG: hypothetical protein ACRC9F_02325 [Metamycoplasmataceae bacterium]